MSALRRLELKTRVTITPNVTFHIDVYQEKSAAGGIRANLITRSKQTRGPEVWIDAPEMRQLRDLLNEVLGD